MRPPSIATHHMLELPTCNQQAPLDPWRLHRTFTLPSCLETQLGHFPSSLSPQHCKWRICYLTPLVAQEQHWLIIIVFWPLSITHTSKAKEPLQLKRVILSYFIFIFTNLLLSSTDLQATSTHSFKSLAVNSSFTALLLSYSDIIIYSFTQKVFLV